MFRQVEVNNQQGVDHSSKSVSVPLHTFLSDRLSEALDQILTGERAQETPQKESEEATKAKKD